MPTTAITESTDMASASMSDPKAGEKNETQISSSGGESSSEIASEMEMGFLRGGPTESTHQDAPSQSQGRQELAKIHRVRPLLHRVAGDLFTPQTVVIGPYHAKVGSYSYALKEKAYQDIVVKQHKVDDSHLVLDVDDLVDKVKDCYTCLPDNTLDWKMLLHDGLYLLSFFIDEFYRSTETGGSRNDSGDVGSAADPTIFKDSTLVRDVLYLLENQIPFCVLEAILKFLTKTTDENYTLNLISGKVRNRLHEQHYISKNRQPVQLATSRPSDLLHLVYSYFLRGRPVVLQKCSPTGRWRRATDYQKYAALQFRRRIFKDEEEWSILDVELRGCTLFIPFLRMGADTWTMLRNLMALEEQETQRPVTAYCIFMSQVASTAEDVRLLQRAKILEHFLPSDEEAAKSFGNLCNGVPIDIDSLDHNYLRQEWHRLHKRCSAWTYNLIGFFCVKHFNNVSYGVVFLIIGTILFFSNLGQTFFTVYGYFRPRR